jgi:hypothetical protein
VVVANRKRFICAGALVLLVGLLGAGCDKCEICGKYTNDDLPNAFIRLKADGVCIGHGFLGGSWDVVDGELRITSIRGPYVFTVDSGTLVDETGLVWKKEAG